MRHEAVPAGRAARIRGCRIGTVMLIGVGAIACGNPQRGASAQPSTAGAQLADPAGIESADASAIGPGVRAVLDQASGPSARRACIPNDQAEPDSERGVQPWAPEVSTDRDRVPLRAGLTVVTAIATPGGDYESVQSITDFSDSAVDIDLSAVVPIHDALAQKTIPRPLISRRVVLRADQDTACGFAPVLLGVSSSAPPQMYVGTTGITFSARLLAALKTGQHVYVRVMTPEFGGGATDHGHWMHRVEAHPVGIPVILNDDPVMLPALHAQCDSTAGYTSGRTGRGAQVRYVGCEYFILDDARNPLVLISRTMALKEDTTLRAVSDSVLRGTRRTRFLTVNGVLQLDTTAFQVVHLDEADLDLASGAGETPGKAGSTGPIGAHGVAGEHRMEHALSKNGKVAIYGIYFDFAQATIKQASAAALHEIADLMHRNPTWSLSINDYTDNGGDGASDLALSRRRASAVRDALVAGLGIAPTRLTSAGFGAASPVGSNSKVLGRARNRRVELVLR